MKLFVTVIGLVILLIVVDKITNTIFSIEKKKVSESAGKHIDRWGRWILAAIVVIILWFPTDNSDMQRMFSILITLAFLCGYYAVMEFFFVRESRQYITTTVLLLTILICMYMLHQFPFLQN